MMENFGFENGDFNGFEVEGNCEVVSRFHSIDNHPYLPTPSGGYCFARIDDPTVLNGRRVGEKAERAIPIKDFFELDRRPDRKRIFGNGQDIPTDGAFLSRQVEIGVGQKLCFLWAFLRFDVVPSNDFALFFSESDTDSGGTRVVHGDRLCDIITLRNLGDENGRVWYTGWPSERPRPGQVPDQWNPSGWVSYEWAPQAGFKGTVYWVMVNAEQASMGRTEADPAGYRNPSVLLLDNVTIR